MLNQCKIYPYSKETLDMLFHRADIEKQEVNKYMKLFNLSEKEKTLVKTGTILALCMAFHNYTVYALAPENSLMSLWQNLLKYTRLVAYIVFVYKSLETVIKAAIEENLEGCWKKVIGYILGFLGVKYIPMIFDAINNMK